MKQITTDISDKYSDYTREKINNDFKLLNSYKIAINNFSDNNLILIEERVKDFLKDILLTNNDFKSVWYISNIQNTPEKESMKVFSYSIKMGKIDFQSYKGKIENKVQSKLYAVIKNTQNNAVDLYESESGKTVNNIGMSIAIPIRSDNEFIGIIGVDIDMLKFRNKFVEFSNEISSDSYLISGDIVFSLLNEKNIENDLVLFLKKQDIKAKIDTKKTINLSWKNNEAEYDIFVSPLDLGNINKTVALITLTDTDDVTSPVRAFNNLFIFISLISIGIILMVIYIIENRFLIRFNQTSEVLKGISEGKSDLSENLPETKFKEFTLLNNYINTINKNLNQISAFIEEIGKGNFNYEYNKLSEEDYIGNTLIELKENLEISKKEELKRKENDERLNWATGGSAMFAEIIREHSDNLEELSYAIISELVNYIDANQGGLFIISEDEENEKYIELLASYAYDRKKMFEKKIPMGVGLVGRCIQERETIFMTKVPHDYLNITSGLGKEDPTTLLIVPLIFHEEVFGVVELASFRKIEDYKIKLVEQVSEGIASAISMVKINVRTAELLRETKIKSEQAASQEEEIRQNIEEMQTATDELNKKLTNVGDTLNALKSVANITEFDVNGRVTDISPNFLKILKKDKSEVIGKFQGSFSIDAPNVEEFNKFWKDLKKGKRKEFEQMINIEDEIVRVYSIYIPLLNEDGEVYKITGYSEILN